MGIIAFGRYAVSVGALAALLVACGGSQPPIGAPGTISQTVAAARTESTAYRVLRRFDGRSRSLPMVGLTNVNGILYGTSYGRGRAGAVYSISSTGKTRTLYTFHGPDGSGPRAVLLNINGTLYGTTENGGASGLGVVFSLTTAGVENVLYSFKGGSDGAHPYSGVIDVGGTLYGTTHDGGSSSCGCGTVYSVSTTGAETVLHRFAGGSDGEYPWASLVEMNGALFGTTFGADYFSQQFNAGTVYTISTSGSEKVLYGFTNSSSGSNPLAPLIAVKGALYGTTGGGGAYGSGTVFKVSTTGKQRVLYSFRGNPDGDWPGAPLIYLNGAFYGTTVFGGTGCPDLGCGIIYGVTASGSENVLHMFQGGSDGAWTGAGLINAHGRLYGTTQGARNEQTPPYGTVYAVSP